MVGLITTIGKEAGKEEFKQAFNNTLYLPCYSLGKSNYSQQVYKSDITRIIRHDRN